METNDNCDKRRTGDATGVPVTADALKKFRQPLFDYLMSGLDADDKWVRVMAAGMLGALGDPGATGYLRLLAVDHDTDLREVSKKSLMMLYPGHSFSGAGLADPCEGCMIRFIAEEALIYRKKTPTNAQRAPEQILNLTGSCLPDPDKP